MYDSIFFQIKDNQIRFHTGESIKFDYPINADNVVMVDFVIIVILMIPPNVKYNNNVFAVSTSGNLLWQIEVDNRYIQKNNCPFVEVKLNDAERLELFNWCSLGLTVEPFSGKVLNEYTTQ